MPQKKQCIDCKHCNVRGVIAFCTIKEIGLVYDKHPCGEFKNRDVEIVETKKGMFQHPFSFSGRIRRTEYFVSVLLSHIIGFMAEQISTLGLGFGFVEFLALTVWIWFALAQGAKRCHDLGHSGFMQIIPFYNPLWLLIEKGNEGANDFGVSPK
jgi:uncharacterized membrane protein YhaH (DUF805 family)